MSSADPVLDTLFLPFRDGHLLWPKDVLFLRARDGVALREQPRPGLICEQTFKPDADALKRAGYVLSNNDAAKHDLVLILPPRQRDEARSLFARAVNVTSPGGRIVVCVANNEGARSSESDLTRLIGEVSTLSKHKCRVFWSAPLPNGVNPTLRDEWLSLDKPRGIANGRFMSRPGIFAWDHIDAASELLAKHLPDDLHGRAADLGAGFGYLSAELLTRCPRISTLDVYEAEQRALDLAKVNLSSLSSKVPIRCLWQDVTTGLAEKYDVIVTNPPFHTQRSLSRPDIGRRFIEVAADSLSDDGRLWLVANRHLPYEAILDKNFGSVRMVAQERGFKVVEARKGSAR